MGEVPTPWRNSLSLHSSVAKAGLAWLKTIRLCNPFTPWLLEHGIHEGQEDCELLLVKSSTTVCCYKSTFCCLCCGIVSGMLKLSTAPPELINALLKNGKGWSYAQPGKENYENFRLLVFFKLFFELKFKISYISMLILSDPCRCFPCFFPELMSNF